MFSIHRVKLYVSVFAAACLTITIFSAAAVAGSLQQQSVALCFANPEFPTQNKDEEMAEIAEQFRPSVVSIFIGNGRGVNPEPREERGDPPYIERFFREWREKEPFEFFRRQLPKEGEWWRSMPLLPEVAKLRKGVGTGIIMDKEGHIVTASHLIKDSRGDNIRVKLFDKREFGAELIGWDPGSGVAIIRIDAEDLTPARSGNSDELRVGESVLAFGNIRSLGVSVTAGIVSALGRTNLNITTYENFIQTDATIGPGSGGGPLVNMDGEVVGMIFVALGDSDEHKGISFAVPINTVLDVMDDLLSEGKVSRGWLGVVIQEVSTELADKLGLEGPGGVLIGGVSGPAERAGIKAGDVIIEYDGKSVESTNHLKNMVARTEPGEEVAVVIVRKGEQKELIAKIGERTEEAVAGLSGKRRSSAREAEWMGITVQELTSELAREFGYGDEEGVLISDVRKGGSANRKGLRRGDLIQEVENKPIKSIKDYEEAMEGAKSEDSVLLRIKRGDRVWYEVISRQGSEK